MTIKLPTPKRPKGEAPKKSAHIRRSPHKNDQTPLPLSARTLELKSIDRTDEVLHLFSITNAPISPLSTAILSNYPNVLYSPYLPSSVARRSLPRYSGEAPETSAERSHSRAHSLEDLLLSSLPSISDEFSDTLSKELLPPEYEAKASALYSEREHHSVRSEQKSALSSSACRSLAKEEPSEGPAHLSLFPHLHKLTSPIRSVCRKLFGRLFCAERTDLLFYSIATLMFAPFLILIYLIR